MRVLIVNNHSKFLPQLLAYIPNTLVVPFRHLDRVSSVDYDAIILSGGSSLSVKNHEKEYAQELKLIKTTKKPLLGICLGFELINAAYSEPLQRMRKKERGLLDIRISTKDSLLRSLPSPLRVYESHRWVVPKTSFLHSLASSVDGVEIVKHPTKLLYGVQFHPEIFVKKEHIETIFRNFFSLSSKKN